MPRFSVVRLSISLATAAAVGCGSAGDPATGSSGSNGRPRTIGVAFETLQTEFWTTAWEAFRTRAAERSVTVLQAVADGDANRQLEQVRSFISRRVDGIVIVPRDARSVIPMIRAAESAGVPVVLFNRPAGRTDAPHTLVAPDNATITRNTVAYLIERATHGGTPVKAVILLGDLTDLNAVGRRDGFDAAVAASGGRVEVVARVPTDWNQEKALAGMRSVLQAHPDIGLIFTSSDFMLPSVKSALVAAGRWKPAGEAGHVVLGGFDGDPTAYDLLVQRYLDATGVQDVHWEVDQTLKVLLDTPAGSPRPARIEDPGFVITQGNRLERAARTWGAMGRPHAP